VAEEHCRPALPAGLAVLFGDGGAGRTLPAALPAGRLVRPDLDRLRLGPKPTTVPRPAYWLSDRPASAALWRRLHAEHARSGLWPLLLAGLGERPQRPWVAGEVDPEPAAEVDGHDAAGFLATRWTNYVEGMERAAREDDGSASNLDQELAPLGRAWPGLAPALGSGWSGSARHPPPQRRRPPATLEHALWVAAEHLAFCPDNVQADLVGLGPNPLAAYAEQIRGEQSWAFWWD
jgi:Domain of unknown function (DUF4253)